MDGWGVELTHHGRAGTWVFLSCKVEVAFGVVVVCFLFGCAYHSLVDFGAVWNENMKPWLGVNWIFLSQMCTGGMLVLWDLLQSHTESSLFWFQSVTMKWVPPHQSLWPTNQRRTHLGWVLSSTELFCMYFLLLMAQCLQSSAVLRCLQGKISSYVVQVIQQ